MSEMIEKKLAAAKILLICVVVLFVLTIGAFALMGYVEKIGLVAIASSLLGMSFWICGVIYLAVYQPFVSSVKWLARKGLENVADDINLENPTLPQSKIYCGYRALFSKKPCAIIPYEEIAWVHVYERRAYGLTVEKAVILYTKEGKKFSLNSDVEEFKWLLENYIIPCAPNVVIGYGREQKALYKQRNPEAVNAGNKVKFVWSIVLMAMGIALMIVGLVNRTLMGPGLVVVLGLLAAGVILLSISRKK